MLGAMGINASAMQSPFAVLFGGIDEDDAMSEFDDIRRRLRRCELDYLMFQTEKNIIPSKLNSLKGVMSVDNKMYEMIFVLEREWEAIRLRMHEFQLRQAGAMIPDAAVYSAW